MTTRVLEAILASHRPTIVECLEAGQRVANSWPSDAVSQSDCVVEPLTRELEASDLLPSLLDILDTAAEALGESLAGNPVPAPPYVVVTSRGPVCRGTLSDGRRIVLCLELFSVSSRPRTYTLRNPDPSSCPTLEIA
jgi:hypothetical protein